MRFGHTSICREDAVSDFDLYESEIEELYQKPEEPKVELTVEEAKEIYWLLEGHRKDYAKIDWENDRDARLVLLKKEGALNEKWREALPNRIEQAEGE